MHVVVPFAFEHTAPHEPQFDVLVFVFVSQPFVAFASQLPKPASHATSAQVPVAHDSVALARAHAVPHVPQFVSVESEASHPFGALPSQLP